MKAWVAPTIAMCNLPEIANIASPSTCNSAGMKATRSPTNQSTNQLYISHSTKPTNQSNNQFPIAYVETFFLPCSGQGRKKSSTSAQHPLVLQRYDSFFQFSKVRLIGPERMRCRGDRQEDDELRNRKGEEARK